MELFDSAKQLELQFLL